MNRDTARSDDGFSLIELMVVVVIIGVLASIAVPTFLNQRDRLWERASLSDLRSTAVLMEQYLADTGAYPARADLTGPYAPHLSQGVTITTVTGGGSTTGYCVQVAHASLPGDTFALSTTSGRPQRHATC